MITSLKQDYRHFLKKGVKQLDLILNKRGDNYKCNICNNNTFSAFLKYRGGSQNIPEFHKRLNMVGSDLDRFGCPFCGANDRERHIFMFFNKTQLWERFSHSRILHFAPEKNLSKKISLSNPEQYIKADFYPKQEDILKIDARNINYTDNSFDFVICNHVLEHIPSYFTAIKEIFRVLKPKGIAILQTPYSKLLGQNFEDKNINTDKQRLFFYGEKDHFRIFSEQHFFKDLTQTGFKLNILRNSDYFDEMSTNYYGVNNKEDLIQVIKPNN